MKNTSKDIRPSSLPKLACCRCYVPAPGDSEAAKRGTRLDGIIREAWREFNRRINEDVLLEDVANLDGLTEDDVAAVQWAIATMIELANGADIETREAELRAAVPVKGVAAGTMDALCAERCFLIDFKTGQMRDYKAQMAAYSLACMEAFFCDEWTAHLLFVDKQEVVTHFFTEAEARALVESIVAAPAEPTACDYCGWCAAFHRCPVTQSQLATVQEVAALEGDEQGLQAMVDELAADEQKAWQFLSAFKVAEKIAKPLKSKIKEGLAGRKSPYFRLQLRAGKKVVNPLHLCPYMMEIGFEKLLQNVPQFPLAVVETIFAEKVHKPVPASIITTAGGSEALITTPANKLLTTK